MGGHELCKLYGNSLQNHLLVNRGGMWEFNENAIDLFEIHLVCIKRAPSISVISALYSDSVALAPVSGSGPNKDF